MTTSPEAGSQEVGPLETRVAQRLARVVDPAVSRFAERLAHEAGALAVIFYGSNLRTGDLEGVLDFYVLMPGAEQGRIWPRISYRECAEGGDLLRAKIATMALSTFERAAAGRSRDTTIWTRFVQPAALVWSRDDDAGARVRAAVADAAKTAALVAVALGPATGTARDYWRGLFRATYRAELRVEKPGREESILAKDPAHFEGLLRAALTARRIGFTQDGERITPGLPPDLRRRVRRWWAVRQSLGKPFNIARLMKATTTFDGAARYGAWKVERHTGVSVRLTPWREKHPILAAPGVLWNVWRERRR
ncbi:hypothetical protein [Pseudopontixanthobacter vadosimaris]|uniref:hypothetical protein n=1 Tax=Pseudopontixanthobacter vadosimaris TaxID=2726450 RepID=UPI0014755965|nr:hypothetical protein [Pseudopontixanthobacter vadosimaris]